MLKGFGGASRNRNINGSYTSMVLIGGVDCSPGLTPDLVVKGGAKIKKGLCVNGMTKLTDVIISGNISPKSLKLNFVGDLNMNGNLFTNTTEFVNMIDIEGNSIVYIQPITTLPFINGSVQITKCPCIGILLGVDMMSGNISYQPNPNYNDVLDVFQYSIVDTCGHKHNVTQLICKKSATVPPFLNNGCLFDTIGCNSGSDLLPYNFGNSVINYMVGSNQIDWSTLEYSLIDGWIQPPDTPTNCDDNLYMNFGSSPINSDFSGPVIESSTTVSYTALVTNENYMIGDKFYYTVSDNGAGTLFMTITSTSGTTAPRATFSLRVNVRVKDTHGVYSNYSTYYFTRSSCR